MGVYVSFDGGDSFRHAGLEETEHIGRIVPDPDQPRRAFVAALGPLWRSGGQRGVFRTEDGGATWEQVLEISADTGVVDLEDGPPESGHPLRWRLHPAPDALGVQRRRDRKAASSGPRTAETPGSALRKGSRRAPSAASAWRSPAPTH